METRTRSRRAPPPASTAPAATGVARKPRRAAPAKAPASSPNVRKKKQGRQAHVELGSPEPETLIPSHIPRRGARAPSRAASVKSINSVPTRAGDASEEEDEDEEDQEVEEEEDENSPTEQAEDGDDNTRLEIMAQTLPDLLTASEDLVLRLQKANHDNPVFRGLLKVKQNAFQGIMAVFEDPEEHSPFIDWTELDELNRRVKLSMPAGTILAVANLASALHGIDLVQFGKDNDIFLYYLGHLDAAFPKLLTTADYPSGTAELALDIRTALMIETFRTQDKKADPYDVVASIFCVEHDPNASFQELFSQGPFNPLVDGGHVEFELCTERLREVVSIIKRPKHPFNPSKLRSRFPLNDLMAKLKYWVQTTYMKLAGPPVEGRASARPDPEVFHDAEEEIADSQSPRLSPYAVESQPIVRLEQGEQEPSLFRGADSVRFLREQSDRRGAAPPSNQLQATPPRGAPRDYPQHSNEELLTASTPPPSRSQRPAAGSPARRVPRSPFMDADDAEDDDDFQQDTRPVNPEKRAMISSSLPPPKRPRVEASRPSATATDRAAMPPPPVPSSNSHQSAPPPPPSSSSSYPVPSQAEYEAVKEAKRAIAERLRRDKPPAPPKQRQQWSDPDTTALIELVAESRAAWATMEKDAQFRFEHPRNQQAYRDKARNLKVDYLIADAVLPPCFDLVRLGQKEIQRLIAAGKNPHRREDELDERGRPINTEAFEDGEDQ